MELLKSFIAWIASSFGLILMFVGGLMLLEHHHFLGAVLQLPLDLYVMFCLARDFHLSPNTT